MKNAEIKSTLLDALKQAGSLLGTSLGKTHSIDKKAELSLVTETDMACDKLIMEICETVNGYLDEAAAINIRGPEEQAG